MKTIKQPGAAQKLMGEVRLARLQLAKAESQLVEAREQTRIARRRRKEAKQAVRRAKKQARLAKKKAAVAKQTLAKLESKLVRPKPAQVKSKPAARRTKSKRKPKPARAATVQIVKGAENTFAGEIEKVASAQPAISETASLAEADSAAPDQISTPNPQE